MVNEKKLGSFFSIEIDLKALFDEAVNSGA